MFPSSPKKINVMFDYCFNEFLKMAEYIQGSLDADKKKFLQLITYVFNQKIENAAPSELKSVEEFLFPRSFENYDPPKQSSKSCEKAVPRCDFLRKYTVQIQGKESLIIDSSHLSRMLNNDHNLRKECAEKRDGKWYVRPFTFLYYISSEKGNRYPIIQQRALSYLYKHKSSSNPK